MLKSKTVWTAVAAIIAAVGGYFTGELEMAEMLQLIVTSGLAVFLRIGVKKSQNAATEAATAAQDAATVVRLTKVPKKKTTG
jgi:hypothetical protein